MKLTKEKIREITTSIVKEAAAQGKFQNYAKGTYNSMIRLLKRGNNRNTPPFSDEAAQAGKSGPPGNKA
jgi:hypothetical protein